MEMGAFFFGGGIRDLKLRPLKNIDFCGLREVDLKFKI
jgi:hypothetical protein